MYVSSNSDTVNWCMVGWFTKGAGIAHWLERRTRDRKVTGSNPYRSGGRIFFSRVNFLCSLLFWYPLHPRVTAVARKRSRPFCQKCRWQVTAKHACSLRMKLRVGSNIMIHFLYILLLFIWHMYLHIIHC